MPDSTEILRDILPEYELPFTYGIIVKEMTEKLENVHRDAITSYISAKTSTIKEIEIQGFLDAGWVNDKPYLFDNVTRLKNALQLKNLGDSASPELKPIMYYYSCEQFMNFFVNSIVKIPSPKNNHGISISPEKNILETRIIMRPSGFFSRLVDVYTIFNENSIFSPLKSEYSQDDRKFIYDVNSHDFALTKEIKFTLDDLLKLDLKYDIISSDLRNIIILYVASHFARYTPSSWKGILDGIKNGLMIHFGKIYSEYDYVIIKHIQTLDDLRRGSYYGKLHQPNVPQSRLIL